MDTLTLTPPRCFSYVEPLDIAREFVVLLVKFTYDGEGKVVWPEYLEDFYAFLVNDFYADEANMLTCIHASQIPTTMVLESATRQCALT